MKMNATKRNPYRILVAGDVVVDHHIYRGDCKHPNKQGCGTRIIRQQGGAALTATLLTELCKKEPLLKVFDATLPFNDELPVDPSMHHAYATWTTFPPSKNPDEKNDPKVWRVNETFGFGNEVPTQSRNTKRPPLRRKNYDVVAIDEGGLGFRDHKRDWPLILKSRTTVNSPWTVLKMSAPVCMGDLWNHLMKGQNPDRLIVIVSADDLRRSEASVSLGLSWEKSVQELLSDLTFHVKFKEITKARHVIVNFGHDGALWIDNSDRQEPKRHLVFDPGHLEGTWQEDLDGTVLGTGACLLSSVVRSLFDQESTSLQWSDCEDLGAGIARGLASRRALLLSGHGNTKSDIPGFPLGDFLKVQKDSRTGNLSMVKVPDFAVPNEPFNKDSIIQPWSIIAGGAAARHCPLYGLAREVAIKGEGALQNLPFGKFNDLYTVDSIELIGFYSLRKLMRDYVDGKNTGKPLSLGVFGPPGAGKSFGIEQIATGILGPDVPILTFNLSQFTNKEMLVGAFHQVRDEVLKGKTPVVFWDEFDSDGLSWLQFMLAPMNDGEFLEGQVTHPLGKCIFIFVGGIFHTREEFSNCKKEFNEKTFQDLKGPDFVSRLRGYLNVLGPNQRKINGVEDESDVGFPIRRAIMLRVQAKKFGSKHLEIDRGLLNAMLKIGEFNHGARSMATIVNLITGGGKRSLMRCNLPPREQLSIHVDYDEFLALIQEGNLFKLNAVKLAPYIHNFYRALAKERRWKFKYDMPYGKLPAGIKKDNIAAAIRLPEILSLAGLMVVDAKSGPGADEILVKEIIEDNLELMAEGEHIGWMDFKKKQNWKWAKKRNDLKKRHPAMKDYLELREVDKDKDRDAVRNYPKIVALAKYVIQIEGCSGQPEPDPESSSAEDQEKTNGLVTASMNYPKGTTIFLSHLTKD